MDFAKLKRMQVVNHSSKDGRSRGTRFSLINLLLGIPGNGKNGKDGSPGPELDVKVSSVLSGDSMMLRLIITVIGNKSKTKTHYVNPRYGRIIIVANGGNGGDGGSGDAVKEGKSGFGGNGGNGGNGGTGGIIHVAIDSSALSFATCACIVYENMGGHGGSGGSGGKGGSAGSYSYPSEGNTGGSGFYGMNGPPIYVMGPNKKVIAIK